jgi:hypothetical protein
VGELEGDPEGVAEDDWLGVAVLVLELVGLRVVVKEGVAVAGGVTVELGEAVLV